MDDKQPFDDVMEAIFRLRTAFIKHGMEPPISIELGHVKDGDWFRATLGRRGVFVQRFGEELRGFENVCVHRFFPLRVENKGNGPIRCGFHHWQYNKDGLAVGIPKCKELFGITPRELGARLRTIDVAVCGSLIFGRFRDDEHTVKAGLNYRFGWGGASASHY